MGEGRRLTAQAIFSLPLVPIQTCLLSQTRNLQLPPFLHKTSALCSQGQTKAKPCCIPIKSNTMHRRGRRLPIRMYGRDERRFDFYHSSHHYGSADFFAADGSLRISLVDERTTERVTYSIPRQVWAGRYGPYPLRELMYTFVEQVGVRLEQLEFRYQGALVGMDATPESLNMRAEEEHVISVSTLHDPHERRVEALLSLNRMGKVTVGIGPPQGEGDVFGSELLPRILEFAGLEALVNASQVCRHWFHVAQRYSVLVQLQDGDNGTWQKGQKYPLLLHDGCRHSFNLALCQAMSRGDTDGEASRTGITMIQKEKPYHRSYGYVKAAGCRLIKTVYMESISRDLDSKWESLNTARTAFMAQVELAQQEREPSSGSETSNDSAAEEQPQQKFPPEGEAGNGFIAEAVDWRYKNCAVELYRRYFSPDMHYIFPLIVNKQAAVGLDFGNCTTSVIFGDSRRPSDQRTPLGSVSWRIHDAEDIACKGMGQASDRTPGTHATSPLEVVHGHKPQVILEVLFIAVWENDRGGEFGSALVADLEGRVSEYAKSNGLKSAHMYVEIGFEQPLAKSFWGNNGFAPVVPKARKGRNPEDVSSGRIVELGEWQLGFIDRRCLRFKDTVQYAKRLLID